LSSRPSERSERRAGTHNPWHSMMVKGICLIAET
jgi:hypothetical protein